MRTQVLLLFLMVVSFGVVDAAPVSSDPIFVALGDHILYFTARVNNVREMWSTDGTASETFRIGGADFVNTPVALSGDTLYISSRDVRIWKSDGTLAGTQPVTQPLPTGALFAGVIPRGLLYLTNATRELWIHSDSGETMLATVRPTVPLTTFTNAAILNGTAFIATEFGLWKSDGTPAGTMQLTTAPAYNVVTASNNIVYFVGNTPQTGDELWITDGTIAGTHIVSDLHPGSASTFALGRTQFGVTPHGLVFIGTSDVGLSDGTEAGTRTIRSASSANRSSRMTLLGNTAFFAFNDGEHGLELWKTDGTEAGTTIVRDMLGDNASMSGIVAGATRVFFYAADATHPADIYESDGTPTGTHAVFNGRLPFTPAAGGNQQIFTNGDSFYFVANDGFTGAEPWISDGTIAGTHLVANVAPETPGPRHRAVHH